MNPLIIVDECYNRLPMNLRNQPWVATNHGRAVLETEDQLNAYIAAYGEMHIIKCKAALQNFPFDELQNFSYEIFDWGCGQGIGTLTLIDALWERKLLYRLKRICLIEPSSYALNRAKIWSEQFAGSGVEIICVNKYIPSNENDSLNEIRCDSPISINIFSNILDVRSVSLSWLSKKTASLAGTNYMLCIGPKFPSGYNSRLSDYCGYFNPTDFFTAIDIFPYSYTTRTNHPFGCEIKCFVHKNNQQINSNYLECADEEINTDPYDYTIECLKGAVDDSTIVFYNKLRQYVESSYKLFFRPHIYCDKVDFLMLSPTNGIFIINVCDNIVSLKDAFYSIKSVKDSLLNNYLQTAKMDSIINKSVLSCVQIALFLPNASEEEIRNEILKIEEADEKYRGSFSYLLTLTRDSKLSDVFGKAKVKGFRYNYYEELFNIISSKWHSYNNGDFNFSLTREQKAIANSDKNRLRVQGVAGSGKTIVVAYRAVYQLIRTGKEVLVITYNLSLVKYIRMRIEQVPADFDPSKIIVINYHQFVISMARRYLPDTYYFDFDNANLFSNRHNSTEKFKSIIIDEIQDFKEPWLKSIFNNFLEDGGSISVFGDGEQNIYGRENESDTRMPRIPEFANIPWRRLSERISMRMSNPRIAELSYEFAKHFIDDNIEPINIQIELAFEQYYIRYWLLDAVTTYQTIVSNIIWLIREFKLQQSDVVVLGQSINFLRNVENEFVLMTNDSTMPNFDTKAQQNEVYAKVEREYIDRTLDNIRRTAKMHFTTYCNKIKFSTIHSFKGWESKTVILLLQPHHKDCYADDDYRSANLEGSSCSNNVSSLIYTAMTRARCNLFILNVGNLYYHNFFSARDLV